MNNIFDFFDKIFVINLQKDTARRQNMNKQFNAFGIQNRVEYISAMPPSPDFKMGTFAYPPGEFGVNLSQIKAVVHAIGSKNVLIFEDDVAFVDNALLKLEPAIKELPQDWDIFYIGGRPKSPLKQVSQNIAKTHDFVQASSYAIQGSRLVDFFDFYSDRITSKFPNCCYDNILGDFAKNNNGYCTYPPIAFQAPGHSSIRNAHRDYRSDTEQDWKKYAPK